MNYKNFDAVAYIRQIVENCKFAEKEKFKFCLISGFQGAEELASNARRETAFVAMDDTIEGETIIRENGPVQRSMCTVFILSRFKMGDEVSRVEAIEKCNTLKLKMLSWILHDKQKLQDAMIYLDEDVQERKVGTIFNGLTGLYFTFSFLIPTSLVFDNDDWVDVNKKI